MTSPAVSFDRVTRTFGRTTALSDFSLTVEPGAVLGLVGRNGAGKSTALRLAMGVLHPDAGSIRVLGTDPVREGLAVRTMASLMSEESALYGWMQVSENLAFASKLHPRWDSVTAEKLTQSLELDTSARVSGLSRGNRAKLSLIVAAACRPEVLFLDDPTASLDPLARREVLEGILDTIPEEGGAVVYASHLIHDVERVADRIAVLDDGKLVLEEDVAQLKAKIRRVEAVFPEPRGKPIDLPECWDVRWSGRLLTAATQHDKAEIVRSLTEQGAQEVKFESLPLEEILIALLREEGSDRV